MHPTLDVRGQEPKGSCPSARQGEVHGHGICANWPSRRLLVTCAQKGVSKGEGKDDAKLGWTRGRFIDARLAHLDQLRRNVVDAGRCRTWVSGSKSRLMQGIRFSQGDSYQGAERKAFVLSVDISCRDFLENASRCVERGPSWGLSRGGWSCAPFAWSCAPFACAH